jgi:hypothetical protein
MYATLLLDTVTWDLCLDANGNIAVAQAPYQLAQDAASACRLFLGGLYYDTTQGIPYFQEIYGQNPPINLLKAKLLSAAESSDPNFGTPSASIASVQVFISSITERAVQGQVQITDTSGNTTVAGF